ncbi:MAG: hypothetical protein AB7J35_14785 [Dehalococcoidia bacterium]
MSLRQSRANPLADAVLVLGPAVAWSLQLLASYFVVSIGRMTDTELRLVLTGITVLTIAAIGVFALVASRNAKPDVRSPGSETDPSDFLKRLALWSCLLFAIAALFFAFPIYSLRDLNGA